MFVPKKSVSLIAQPPYVDPETNKCTAVAIDQFPSQPFMANENGFIANDIFVFENAQSDSVARAALSRIEVLNPKCEFIDMQPDEILEHIVPANLSSPAEFVRIQKAFAKAFYERQAYFAAKKAAEGNIEFKEKDLPDKVD